VFIISQITVFFCFFGVFLTGGVNYSEKKFKDQSLRPLHLIKCKWHQIAMRAFFLCEYTIYGDIDKDRSGLGKRPRIGFVQTWSGSIT